jgi:protein disulfide-isomerase A1
MLSVYGQQPGVSNVLSVYHPSNGQIFPFGGIGQPSAVVVEQFLLDIIDGKVTPWTGNLAGIGRGTHEEL